MITLFLPLAHSFHSPYLPKAAKIELDTVVLVQFLPDGKHPVASVFAPLPVRLAAVLLSAAPLKKASTVRPSRSSSVRRLCRSPTGARPGGAVARLKHASLVRSERSPPTDRSVSECNSSSTHSFQPWLEVSRTSLGAGRR